jgi:hypothetical protein
MTTTSFKFQCPHCAQRLECDIDLAGREIDCPGCERSLIIPEPPAIKARPNMERGVASTCAVRPRDGRSHILRGVNRVRPGKARDQWLALAGIFLSRLMVWGGIIVPCLLFQSRFSW